MLSCIKRELREETGYTARKIRHLIDFWPTPAFSSELLRVYVARGLVPGRRSLDHDEFLEVVTLPFREALGLVRSGRIRDSKTVIALLAMAASKYGKYEKV
jgi:ADP-ribose pyrophosphatase